MMMPQKVQELGDLVLQIKNNTKLDFMPQKTIVKLHKKNNTLKSRNTNGFKDFKEYIQLPKVLTFGNFCGIIRLLIVF